MNYWSTGTSTASTSTTTSWGYDGPTIVIDMGGFAPPPPRRVPLPSPVLEACRTLGLTPPLESFEVVQKRYRELAKEHHPDLGGDAEKMKAINAAYELLSELRPR